MNTGALDVGVLFVVYSAAMKLQERQRRRRCRRPINDYLCTRNVKGRFAREFENMIKTPSVFFENLHMSLSSFQELFALVAPHLMAKRNTRRDAIPLEAKLALTLEYLACGTFQCHIASSYHISKQHVDLIISHVCHAITVALSGEVEAWDVAGMLKSAKDFQEQWQFPNCIGALDGKHIAIKAPPGSGSAFYNYKGFHSIILIGISDASCKFSFIDVGAYGSEGDMEAFSKSWVGKDLFSDNMEFPEDAMLGGVRTPYFLVADDAFPLHKRIMKPYGLRNLTKEERIFNYRLSRARRCIENAFGILSARWAAVQLTLLCHPERAQKIVSAACVLHNFCMRTNRPNYELPVTTQAIRDSESNRGRPQDYPKHVRNNIKNYVNSVSGSVSGQDEYAGIANIYKNKC